MKNIFITLGLVLGSALGLLAQDCATGYCPAKIYTHHKAGAVSPVDVDITYGVKPVYVTRANKCWITQNLGATVQATSVNDASDAAAGWTWQFGNARGFAFKTTGTVAETTPGDRTPNTTWITSITGTTDWPLTTDPCRLLLGGTWRLPTKDEWSTADSYGPWDNPTDAFNDLSLLRLHNGGGTYITSGVMWNRSFRGYFWSSTTNGLYFTEAYMLYMSSTTTVACDVRSLEKSSGASVRCLRDL